MIKYTKEDLASFERDEDGRIMCLPGDYTQILIFPAKCNFPAWCYFGRECVFGALCNFDRGCCFGRGCSFDAGCRFEKLCEFGRYCCFSNQCEFDCECIFGDWCKFGKGCTIENGKEMADLLKFGGFGHLKRTTYFFLLTDGKIYVRCGCFAGFLNDFRKRVVITHGESQHAQDYLAIADLAEKHWGGTTYRIKADGKTVKVGLLNEDPGV